MNDVDKITADAESWENGVLGQEEKFAVRSSADAENALNEALDLQMISVRLQKNLIEDLKFIAKVNGMGYQPLMRVVLARFVESEKKNIMMEILDRKRLENELKEKSEAEIKPEPNGSKQQKAA